MGCKLWTTSGLKRGLTKTGICVRIRTIEGFDICRIFGAVASGLQPHLSFYVPAHIKNDAVMIVDKYFRVVFGSSAVPCDEMPGYQLVDCLDHALPLHAGLC